MHTLAIGRLLVLHVIVVFQPSFGETDRAHSKDIDAPLCGVVGEFRPYYSKPCGFESSRVRTRARMDVSRVDQLTNGNGEGVS